MRMRASYSLRRIPRCVATLTVDSDPRRAEYSRRTIARAARDSARSADRCQPDGSERRSIPSTTSRSANARTSHTARDAGRHSAAIQSDWVSRSFVYSRRRRERASQAGRNSATFCSEYTRARRGEHPGRRDASVATDSCDVLFWIRASATARAGLALGVGPQRNKGWWTAGGSNSRPPRCERGALPTELAAH